MNANANKSDFEPIYSKWRHGGWYVHNARYPNGACGCVSNNYPDKKWRIVSETNHLDALNGPDDFTFKSRHDAAVAEHMLIKSKYGV